MSRHSGPGKLDKLYNPPRFLLYNFNIDESNLKPEHQTGLQNMIVPTLRSGGSVSIVGLASRSGTFSHNDHISLLRAQNVRAFLQQKVFGGFPVREFKAFGERKAQLDHRRDGSEDERYRSVLLFLSSGPIPPIPNLDVVAIPIPEIGSSEGVLDTIGKILDVVSSLGSILNLVLDAVLIDLAGTVLAAISAVIGMPAVWIESNNFAKGNGKKLGFSKAMQQMSDAFASDDLRSVPEANWPPIPHPVPKFPDPDDAVIVAERSARAGQREGYEAAWAVVMQLEKEPREFPVNLKGKLIRIRLSGRRFLWLIHRAYKEDVWRRILQRLG